MSSAQCLRCGVSFDELELVTHLEEAHVDKIDLDMIKIRCGTCAFTVAHGSLSLLIKHCNNTRHPPSAISAAWNTFIFKENERLKSLISSGIQLTNWGAFSIEEQKPPLKKEFQQYSSKEINYVGGRNSFDFHSSVQDAEPANEISDLDTTLPIISPLEENCPPSPIQAKSNKEPNRGSYEFILLKPNLEPISEKDEIVMRIQQGDEVRLVNLSNPAPTALQPWIKRIMNEAFPGVKKISLKISHHSTKRKKCISQKFFSLVKKAYSQFFKPHPSAETSMGKIMHHLVRNEKKRHFFAVPDPNDDNLIVTNAKNTETLTVPTSPAPQNKDAFVTELNNIPRNEEIWIWVRLNEEGEGKNLNLSNPPLPVEEMNIPNWVRNILEKVFPGGLNRGVYPSNKHKQLPIPLEMLEVIGKAITQRFKLRDSDSSIEVVRALCIDCLNRRRKRKLKEPITVVTTIEAKQIPPAEPSEIE